jgi:cytochrome c
MEKPVSRIVLFLLLISLARGAHAAGDADRGRALYAAKCAACHSLDYNGAGPAHKGVFGRQAGRADGYDYSPALRASKLIWSEATLDRWLANPANLVPGQKMGITIPDARERRDLIAYLKAAAN